MRIAFFCTRFPTVSETFVLAQLSGLLDQGFDVDIHALKPGDDDVQHPIFKKYQLAGRTSYRGRQGSVLGRMIQALVLILRFGLFAPIKLVRLFCVTRATPEVGFVAALFALKGLCSGPSADLVYAHFGPNGQVVATLKAAGFVTAPIVTVFHGFDVTVLIKRWGNDYYQTLFKHGSLMMPVSEEFKNRLMSFGCPADKILVQHMGVDTDALKYIDRTNPKANETVKVLSIARLVPKKGIDKGIAAVAAMTQQGFENIEYHIVGDGELKAKLAAQIDELGCSKQIRLLGWMDQTEVQKQIESAHIYLAPSVTADDGDEEGIPVVLMEAAASGLAIVSTLHSGIPELVRHEETGLLAAEHDVSGLENALKRLSGDPSLKRRLGQNARQLVEEEFSLEILNQELGRILTAEAGKSDA